MRGKPTGQPVSKNQKPQECFKQDVPHPLQRPLRDFDFRFEFKHDNLHFSPTPQRFAYSKSYASRLGTKKNIQVQHVAPHPDQANIIEIPEYRGRQLCKEARQFGPAPRYEKKLRKPVTRFMNSPTKEFRRKTRLNFEPDEHSALYSSEKNRLRRKQGPDSIYAFEMVQRKDKERMKRLASIRQEKRRVNEARILKEYERMTKLRERMTEKRIKNMTEARRKAGTYAMTDPKFNKYPFPYGGPTDTTILKCTPTQVRNTRHLFCQRLNLIGQRRKTRLSRKGVALELGSAVKIIAASNAAGGSSLAKRLVNDAKLPGRQIRTSQGPRMSAAEAARRRAQIEDDRKHLETR
ncbi:hypothetical protein AAMO2058_000413700 [Amorphochlora amoebiformis]|uniref:Uncharacterized protein n=1 Tax=Amorphochlora amoebiformis TaxID=1561963 RepID=A0A7S0CZX4_9EUKA|mmetsp:Transcript_16455/g.26065  ORF Transcript_16455/g.26065 Transcript_16455/m.26065 type:complete len:350 (+) Transcript_16455:76-1125(+)